MLALAGDTGRLEAEKVPPAAVLAAAHLVHTGRRRWLRLPARWPWTDVITHAIDGLHALPNLG